MRIRCRQLLAVCLVIAMLLPVLPGKVLAASDTWGWSTADKPSGWGTKTNPYVITTPEQLLRVLQNLSKGYYAVLGCNINLSAKIWPGTKCAGFAASLDGQGHTIWGMRSDCGALIQSLYEGGSISNINIEVTSAMQNSGALVNVCWGNVTRCTAFGTVHANLNDLATTTAKEYIAGLVCLQQNNVAGDVCSTISDCKSFVNYHLRVSGSGSDRLTVAGIVGRADGNVVNCENYGNIQVTNIYDDDEWKLTLAGVVGNADSGQTVVENCINQAQITAVDAAENFSENTGHHYAVGGVVGSILDSTTVTGCENYGNIDGSGCVAGGIVGTYDSDGDTVIKGCMNKGEITSLVCSGGIAGRLVVFSDDVTVIECANYGDVAGDGYVGGIVGYNQGRVEESENRGTVISESIQSTCGGIVGYNYAENWNASAEPAEQVSGAIISCINTGKVNSKGYSGGVTGINEGFVCLSENTGSVTGYCVGGIAAYNQPYVINWGNYGVIDSCTANCALESTGGEAAGIAINGSNTEEATIIIRDSYFRGNMIGNGGTAYGVAGWGANTVINGCYAVFSACGFHNAYALYPADGTTEAPAEGLCAGVYANNGGVNDLAELHRSGWIRSAANALNTLGGTVASRGTWRAGGLYPEPSGLPIPIALPTVGSVDENGHTVYHATDGQRIIRINAQGWVGSRGALDVTATVTHEDGTVSVYSSEWRTGYAEFRLYLDDTDTVALSAEGYQTTNVSAALLGFLTEIKLWKTCAEGTPNLIGFYMDESAGGYRKTYNLLTESYGITQGSKTKYTFYVDVNWNGGDPGEVYLMQGDNQRLELLEGWNYQHRLGQILEWEEGDITILLDNGEKQVTVPIELKLREPIKEKIPMEGGDSASSGGGAPEHAEGIAGQSFSVDFGALSDLGIPLKVKIDPDDSITATFGVTLGKASQKSSLSGATASKHETSYATIKDSFEKWSQSGTKVSEEQYNNLVEQVVEGSDVLESRNAHYGINVGMQFLGYGEGSLHVNRPWFNEIGGMIQVNGEIKYVQPVYIVVPFYVETGIKATGRFLGALESDPSTGKMVPKGYLEDAEANGFSVNGELEFFGGPGIGDPRIISVGLRAVGTIKMEMTLPHDIEQAKISSQVEGQVVGSIVGYEGEWTTWSGDEFVILEHGEWFPEYDLLAASELSLASLEEPERAYLSEDSLFLGNGIMLLDDSQTIPEGAVLTNIYPYAEIQQVAFLDGSRLMVWNGDLAERPDADRSALYYSYYDGTYGVWTEPALVEPDDGTADYYPALRCIDDTAYVVWNDADSSLEGIAGEAVTEEDLINRLNTFGVSYARFDRDQESFADIASVTGKNGTADLLADVTVVNDIPTVVWVSSSNGLSQADGVLYSAALAENGWTPVQLTELAGTDGLAAGTMDGELAVYYSRGKAPYGLDLYCWTNGEEFALSDESDIAETKPTISNGFLAWYEDGAVRTEDGLTQPISGGGDRFQYLFEPATGRQAVVYSTITAEGGTLQAMFADGGIWGEPVTVAQTENGIFQSFSAVLLADGTLSVIANQWDDSDERVANLVQRDINPYPSLTLEVAEYNELTLVPGAELEVILSISNTGARAAQGFCVDFYDGDEWMDSCFVSADIPSGASKSVTAFCTLPDTYLPRELTVQVYAVGTQPMQTVARSGCNAADSAQITLNTGDLSLEEVYAVQLDDSTLVTVQAVNRGDSALPETTVVLRMEDSDGIVLAQTMTNVLQTGDSETVVFQVEERLEAGTVVYVVAEEQSEEENLISNNSVLAVVQESKTQGFSYECTFEDGVCTITAANETEDAMAIRFIVASYEAGQMVDCAWYDAELSAYTTFWRQTLELEAGDEIKMFLLDSDLKPLAEAVPVA